MHRGCALNHARTAGLAADLTSATKRHFPVGSRASATLRARPPDESELLHHATALVPGVVQLRASKLTGTARELGTTRTAGLAADLTSATKRHFPVGSRASATLRARPPDESELLHHATALVPGVVQLRASKLTGTARELETTLGGARC